MFPVGLVASFFWGAGTNLLDERWYVFHGVSIGDVLLMGWVCVAGAADRRALVAAFQSVGEHTALVTVFICLMLLSTSVNAFRYGADWNDAFAILRYAYFTLIIVVTTAFVRRHGVWPILFAFLLGVAFLALGRVADAAGGDVVTVLGLPVLRDSNVVGNMMGIGIALASVGILVGHSGWSLALTIGFAAVSVLTYSKGAWFMVAAGIAASFAALLIRYPLTASGLRRMIAAAMTFAILLGGLTYAYWDRLSALIDFKLQSTSQSDTVSDRYRYAVAGLYAMGEHPLFGIGLRNFRAVATTEYPELDTGEAENAHNAFVQIGAVGGIPTLLVFLLLFLYPFVDLWHALRARGMTFMTVIYFSLIALVFVTSAAVQLQVMAQPFLWFFTGLMRGSRSGDPSAVRAVGDAVASATLSVAPTR